MQGHITKFREDIGFGVIHSEDGRRFRFSGSEIYNPNGSLVGRDVDFVVESRKPRDIIVLHGSPWAAFARSNIYAARS